MIFGKEPPQIISRVTQSSEVLMSFQEEPPEQQIYMITGVRGCGKTVLAIYQLVVDIYKFPRHFAPVF